LRRTGRQTGRAKSSPSRASAPAPQIDGDATPQIDGDATAGGDSSLVTASNLSLHELFEQQARNMLDRADIDEEQRQSILVAMACPCCGAGGMSFSVKLKKP
jgi:hypothetical protein